MVKSLLPIMTTFEFKKQRASHIFFSVSDSHQRRSKSFVSCCPVWSSDLCIPGGYPPLNTPGGRAQALLCPHLKQHMHFSLLKTFNWKPASFTNTHLALMVCHEYPLCCTYNLFKLFSDREKFKAQKICLLVLNKMPQCHLQSL